MVFNLNLYVCHVDELKSVEHVYMESLSCEIIVKLHLKRIGDVRLADLMIVRGSGLVVAVAVEIEIH